MKWIKRIIFQGAKDSLREEGLWATISRASAFIIDFYFDIKYGTNTSTWIKLDDLKIESDNKKRGVHYQPSYMLPLRKLFNNIKLMIPADSAFVDFGCGKGKVLLVASKFGFRKVRGVEFSRELCEIAKNNCAVYEAKTAVRTEVQIIESDVVDYVINTDENVFYMFNPFDEVVLGEVLNNIATSLKIQPRKILIIYCTPKYGNFIEQHDNFVKSRDFVSWGCKYTVYLNRD